MADRNDWFQSQSHTKPIMAEQERKLDVREIHEVRLFP